MKITDKYELLALHRCLFECKFNPNVQDTEIIGSPIVAKLANDVVHELIKLDGLKWEKWRAAEKHPEKIRNLIVALKQQDLKFLSPSDYEQFMKNAISPLIASEELLTEICGEVF